MSSVCVKINEFVIPQKPSFLLFPGTSATSAKQSPGPSCRPAIFQREWKTSRLRMDRGWETIKSVIDRSDYYVLILAGRYGSVYRRGKSWTEKEYEYAVLRNIPVLAFIRAKRSIRADAMDEDSALRAKLEES